jgi:hypothetical protein
MDLKFKNANFSFFGFLRNIRTALVALICVPINSIEVFLLYNSIAVVCVIDDSHSDWGEVESQCGFDLHFL